MKKILYVIYALMFYLYSIVPLNKNKTTFIMTHDDSINGNIMCMYRKVKEEQPNHICKFITRSQLRKGNILSKLYYFIKFIFITPYYLATSSTVFLDNVFLPMAYIKFKSQVKVVQLWHGCNTLKKFGQLSNEGLLKKLEKRANSNYTHVIVSSKKMVKLHIEVFGVNKEVIYPVGLPRMDIFFDLKRIEEEKEKFYTKYKEFRNKRIILYAPTFRDNDLNNVNSNMDLTEITKYLPGDFIIITKFHPFVSNRIKECQNDKLIDMSAFEDLNRLLIVSDILITDYSSIIFDYALLNKPIIFYAYDKDEYENNIRGFYYNYDQYIEGKTVKYKVDLTKEIISVSRSKVNMQRFINKYMDYLDNNSTSRVYKLIYLNQEKSKY